MNWIKLVLILTVFGLFFGCADVIEEADKTIIDSSKLPLMFYSVDPVAEKFLYEAMYTSPIKWNPYDLEKVLSSRGTLKMASEYLVNKEKTAGGITFFTLREFLDFTTYAFTEYEQGADGRAYQKGQVNDKTQSVLTDEQKWIYEKVKNEVWTNLKSLRSYIDAVADDIDGEVNAQTLERFKQAFSIIENIIPIKLPDNLDF